MIDVPDDTLFAWARGMSAEELDAEFAQSLKAQEILAETRGAYGHERFRGVVSP